MRTGCGRPPSRASVKFTSVLRCQTNCPACACQPARVRIRVPVRPRCAATPPKFARPLCPPLSGERLAHGQRVWRGGNRLNRPPLRGLPRGWSLHERTHARARTLARERARARIRSSIARARTRACAQASSSWSACARGAHLPPGAAHTPDREYASACVRTCAHPHPAHTPAQERGRSEACLRLRAHARFGARTNAHGIAHPRFGCAVGATARPRARDIVLDHN